MLYNEANLVVHDMAKESKVKFTKDYGILLASLEAEETEQQKNDKACSLCGCELSFCFFDKKFFAFVCFRVEMKKQRRSMSSPLAVLPDDSLDSILACHTVDGQRDTSSVSKGPV
eukprot:1011792-Ditylum_brightwellii.AAC.1